MPHDLSRRRRRGGAEALRRAEGAVEGSVLDCDEALRKPRVVSALAPVPEGTQPGGDLVRPIRAHLGLAERRDRVHVEFERHIGVARWLRLPCVVAELVVPARVGAGFEVQDAHVLLCWSPLGAGEAVAAMRGAVANTARRLAVHNARKPSSSVQNVLIDVKSEDSSRGTPSMFSIIMQLTSSGHCAAISANGAPRKSSSSSSQCTSHSIPSRSHSPSDQLTCTSWRSMMVS
eukprot:CAMPEP_0181189994 /NCGR_PEP_ID=MMETSP1096-20121128/11956_1 /TAXON_ID=156174 ORGANISM="Chrysochromulina ericina, Strain CCMP281" /NCGR_SAMPLE_ID=MMETSP1096 /ASSEMBLY_ACC=CAM_ASM_000453 /LENGTH=231 /DNA_ID=CAMNT_0023279179 /DNA_START=355 /DNA_END=1051 /DNA_ORIENTATION=-